MQEHTKYPKLKLNPNTHIRIARLCMFRLCTTMVHDEALNSSDNLPSYTPDDLQEHGQGAGMLHSCLFTPQLLSVPIYTAWFNRGMWM